MAKRNEWVDPGRRRILQRQDDEGSRRWTIDPEILRVILVEAVAELGSPELLRRQARLHPRNPAGGPRRPAAGRRRHARCPRLEYLPGARGLAPTRSTRPGHGSSSTTG